MTWKIIPSDGEIGGGIPEAPLDDRLYGRKMGIWQRAAESIHAHAIATTSANGFMSSTDKATLNNTVTDLSTHKTDNNLHLPSGGATGQFLIKTSNGTDWTDNAVSSHSHGDLTNDGKIGTLANKPLITADGGKVKAGSFGSSPGNFCEGNDSRLSDARKPTQHNHNASEITTGLIAPQRLGAGTPNNTLFLRGDGVWGNPTANSLVSNSPEAGILLGSIIPNRPLKHRSINGEMANNQLINLPEQAKARLTGAEQYNGNGYKNGVLSREMNGFYEAGMFRFLTDDEAINLSVNPHLFCGYTFPGICNVSLFLKVKLDIIVWYHGKPHECILTYQQNVLVKPPDVINSLPFGIVSFIDPLLTITESQLIQGIDLEICIVNNDLEFYCNPNTNFGYDAAEIVNGAIWIDTLEQPQYISN